MFSSEPRTSRPDVFLFLIVRRYSPAAGLAVGFKFFRTTWAVGFQFDTLDDSLHNSPQNMRFSTSPIQSPASQTQTVTKARTFGPQSPESKGFSPKLPTKIPWTSPPRTRIQRPSSAFDPKKSSSLSNSPYNKAPNFQAPTGPCPEIP